VKTNEAWVYIAAYFITSTLVSAQEREISVILPDSSTMDMIWISPGTFMMGTTEQQREYLLRQANMDYPTFDEDEVPAHLVTITSGFYIGKYEVTRAQWTAVMNTTPWTSWVGFAADPDVSMPASYVSWFDVQEFMNRLNSALGDTVYRLPTEAEWEYVARAGTTTLWFFGDDMGPINDYAAIGDGYPGGFARVGSKMPNPWGLYDVCGNVWEWVLDYEGWYTQESQIDPIGTIPKKPRDHVGRRGGATGDGGINYPGLFWVARSAWRDGLMAQTSGGNTGFRVLRLSSSSTVINPGSWGQVKGDSSR
jgi:formylglycine-generating enzyme required for sulfatase activity